MNFQIDQDEHQTDEKREIRPHHYKEKKPYQMLLLYAPIDVINYQNDVK